MWSTCSAAASFFSLLALKQVNRCSDNELCCKPQDWKRHNKCAKMQKKKMVRVERNWFTFVASLWLNQHMNILHRNVPFPAPVNNWRIKDVQHGLFGSSVWDVDMGGQFKQKVYRAEGRSFVVATNLIRALEYSLDSSPPSHRPPQASHHHRSDGNCWTQRGIGRYSNEIFISETNENTLTFRDHR